MAIIPEHALENHKELKKLVEHSHTYFEENYKCFDDFTKFVFDTALTIQDIDTLEALGKPTLEFNILESFISRLRGEFAKQQPSLQVRAADGIPVSSLTPEFNKSIEVIEAHLRSIFFDASNDKLEYDVYSDLLAGGFSIIEVYTDYVNEMSFEQNIIVNRVFSPTLCGFDPLARKSHKGDGRYCFQLYPMTKKAFEKEFGSDLVMGMSWASSLAGFHWSYRDESEQVILVCDFYEKKKKRVKIAKLTDSKTIFKKDYDNYVKEWKSKKVGQAPIITSERWTEIEQIVRYRFCESAMIDYMETNYKYLPLVFVDGNSAMITEGGSSRQKTRPYVYNAKGIQRLKNFSGQTLANELENLVTHKFVVARESIPIDYQEAYQNVQKQNTLIYNHFLDQKMPDITLPPPREVMQHPIQPAIAQTFMMADQITQAILGSYDSVLGVQGQNQEISGAAMALGAMQSNNASVPYIVGYIKGLNQVAHIIVDLIPKYYRTPRSLPIVLPNGKRDYRIINDKATPGSIFMNYDPNSLLVNVSAGVNFSMQKEQALKTIIGLMQASQSFAEFMNAQGLSILLDNIDIRGIDSLKSKAEKFEEQKAKSGMQTGQQQEQLAQMQLQLTIEQLKAQISREQAEAAKLNREAQGPSDSELELIRLKKEAAFDEVKANQDQQKIDITMIETIAKLRQMNAQDLAMTAKIDEHNAKIALEALSEIIGFNTEPQLPIEALGENFELPIEVIEEAPVIEETEIVNLPTV
jgi:portal protein